VLGTGSAEAGVNIVKKPEAVFIATPPVLHRGAGVVEYA
jgi:hypothetical protein